MDGIKSKTICVRVCLYRYPIGVAFLFTMTNIIKGKKLKLLILAIIAVAVRMFITFRSRFQLITTSPDIEPIAPEAVAIKIMGTQTTILFEKLRHTLT